jgi:hydrogenase nickel incorporation protein HypA/HybF
MHELSIAESIMELARRHVPEGARLKAVRVRFGPMRGIEPQAMQWAWQGVQMTGGGAARIGLKLEQTPWTLRCGQCGHEWQDERIVAVCRQCGLEAVRPVGGDELQLVSIEVDDDERKEGAP